MPSKEFVPSLTRIIDSDGRKLSLLSLALPKFAEKLFNNLIGLVSTVMLAGYADNAVGASATANQIINLVHAIYCIASTGATILCGIELGRSDRTKAAVIAGNAFTLCMLISIISSGALCIFAEPLMVGMNLEADALEYAVIYLRIRGGFIFILAINSFLNSMLICNGYTVYTMINGIGSTILATFFNYLLLYREIIPGVTGTKASAIASVLACSISFVYMLCVFISKKCPFTLAFGKDVVIEIFRIGLPAAAATILYTLSQTITTGTMADLGISSLNAKAYIATIVAYISYASDALSGAMQILIGRYAGREDTDSIKRLCRICLRFSVGTNLALSLGVLAFHGALMSLFTSDPEIIAIARVIFFVDVAVEIFRAVNTVMQNALNACRDVRTTFIAGVISCWCGSVLLSILLGNILGLGLLGYWIAFTLDEAFRSAVFIIRWRREKWQKNIVRPKTAESQAV